MNILVNALGITDSGGLTVLNNFLQESSLEKNEVIIVYSISPLIDDLISSYQKSSNLKFFPYKRTGFFRRFWIEHIHFKKIIDLNHIDILYNFSGSAQFLKIPQLVKLQNLMFFSKTLDKNYKFQNQWLKWLKQIYLKRIILLLLYRSQRFFEVQSLHVKDAILEFISEKNKTFFIKSDFEVEQFSSPKEYLFSEKVIFLFIVGPHFQIVHKNFKIFVEAMTILQKEGVNFEIAITLTDVQLEHSKIWNKSLSPLTKFIGYASREELTKNFDINTILVSTSIVETIGLHVIEALKNGCLAIVPDEPYSRAVYGSHLPTFQTNNPSSLSQSILAVLKKSSDDCRKIISQSQLFFKENEKSKLRHASEIFNLMNSKNEP